MFVSRDHSRSCVFHFCVHCFFFFFFQAEDGIRDHCVTGVQTCALPISEERRRAAARARQLPYRLQNVSSKPTSQSAMRGRGSSPFCARKRILRTYLLALISGTQGVSASRRTRSICAVLPPSICW